MSEPGRQLVWPPGGADDPGGSHRHQWKDHHHISAERGAGGGLPEFKHEKFNIAPILEKSLKQFYVTCDVREIEIVNEINDFEFVGDENWTGEAIENIIKNCIEHTNNNGKLRFFSQMTNVYNSLFIQDNGCGITKEDLPHIFERFYHGKNSSSESVGIGLALAKTVLEKEKGDIIVNSELGKGSIFELRFYKTIV